MGAGSTCGRRARQRVPPSRKRASPKLTRSPGHTSASSSRRTPFRRVPLREPRSRRSQRSPSRRSSAWRRETLGSARTQSQSRERPRVTGPSRRRERQHGHVGALPGGAEVAVEGGPPGDGADEGSAQGARRAHVCDEGIELFAAARVERALDALREGVDRQAAVDRGLAQRARYLLTIRRRWAEREGSRSVRGDLPMVPRGVGRFSTRMRCWNYPPRQAAVLRSARGITKRMPLRSSSIEQVLLSIRPSFLAWGTSAIWLR